MRSRSFESVLDTSIPERKFDFSLDYRVINELASRNTRGPGSSRSTAPSRLEYLKKTIATYRRTLAIDSENVGAHYGLGLAYGDPAWGDKSTSSLRPMLSRPLAGGRDR